MDPVTEFLELSGTIEKDAGADDLAAKQQKELKLWQSWKQGGMQPAQLKPLISSLRPLINKEANAWANVIRDVPPAAIRAEFMNHAVQALATYDPEKGKINTHLRSSMRKAQRFVTTYQNLARIPETRIYKIGEFQRATQRLEETLGRAPTQHELADELKWSPKTVGMLQQEVRKAFPVSQFEHDPTSVIPSQQAEVLRLLPYDLSSEEKAVFEYIYGLNGKPRLSPGEIATKLKMSAPKVSRLKKSIADKYMSYVR